jgi:hypothetical protein
VTNWTNVHRRLGKRTAIVMAGAVGFAVGAGGLVAANHDPRHADDSPSTSVDDTATPSTVDATVPGDDSTTSVPGDSAPGPTIDDSTASSTPNDSVPDDTIDDADDDNTSTSVPDDSVPDDTIDDADDDNTSTSVPDDSVPDSTIDDGDDDDDDTSTSVPDDSVPPSLPDPFTQTFTSAGGSVTVSWSGTALHLEAISPAAGFSAEIEDNDWDRVRVDFEGDDDHRVEVRLNDGSIRIRID